jgi:hypothetical protein
MVPRVSFRMLQQNWLTWYHSFGKSLLWPMTIKCWYNIYMSWVCHTFSYIFWGISYQQELTAYHIYNILNSKPINVCRFLYTLVSMEPSPVASLLLIYLHVVLAPMLLHLVIQWLYKWLFWATGSKFWHSIGLRLYIWLYKITDLEIRGISTKISSVCKYCHCSTVVTMVRIHAEFVGSLGRHRHHLQATERCSCMLLCVYNFKKIEKPTACEMWSVIHFLTARNMKLADIHHLCEV